MPNSRPRIMLASNAREREKFVDEAVWRGRREAAREKLTGRLSPAGEVGGGAEKRSGNSEAARPFETVVRLGKPPARLSSTGEAGRKGERRSRVRRGLRGSARSNPTCRLSPRGEVGKASRATFVDRRGRKKGRKEIEGLARRWSGPREQIPPAGFRHQVRSGERKEIQRSAWCSAVPRGRSPPVGFRREVERTELPQVPDL